MTFPEFAAFGVMLVLVGVVFIAQRRQAATASVHVVEAVGSWNGIDVDVVAAPGGRRFVGVYAQVERYSDEPGPEIWVLITPRQARQLARMARIAVSPGRTLAEARLAELRARQSGSAG